MHVRPSQSSQHVSNELSLHTVNPIDVHVHNLRIQAPGAQVTHKGMTSPDIFFKNPSIAKAFLTITSIILQNDILLPITHHNPQISDRVNTIKDNTSQHVKKFHRMTYSQKCD
jgi:hypothetical protein